MKRFLLVLSFLLFLTACSGSEKVTFVDNIVIEYGEKINPVNWVKSGPFKTITLRNIDEELLGSQQVIAAVEYKGEIMNYPLTIKIQDTKGPEIINYQPFEVPLNSEVKITDYFQSRDVRDGDLVLEHTPLDTSSLGSKRMVIWSVDKVGNRTQKEVIMNVIDVNPPIISQRKEFLVQKGSEINIHEYFKFEDEQKDYLEISIANEYNLNEPGSYPVIIVASDPSGNTNRYETVLMVYKEADEQMDGYVYIEPARVREDRYTLVNRRYQLGYEYVPNNLVLFPDDYRMGDASATLETVAAFVEMAEAATKENVSLSVEYGYISFWNQSSMYNKAVQELGVEKADIQMSRAGHSEHQLGVAIDICEAKTLCKGKMGDTMADQWLKKNADEYGFILRYPKNKVANTGVEYNPYHYRFVGKEVAKHFITTGLSYEEYYQQFSERLK